MTPERIATILLFAPLAGLAVNVVSHILVCRALPRVSHLFAIMIGFAIGAVLPGVAGVAMLVTADLSPANLLGYSLLMFCTYSALGYGYFTLVNLTATSLRIRILRFIFESPHRSIGVNDLGRFYGADDLLGIRLERLSQWGQITRNSGSVVVPGTPAFLLLHRVILVLRKLLLPRK